MSRASSSRRTSVARPMRLSPRSMPTIPMKVGTRPATESFVNHVPFPPVIHGARTGITRSGDEFLIHTEVGDLQFKPKRPFQSRATDISFITHPAPDDIPMGNVYHEMQLDGLLTLSSEAAKQSGRTS